MCTVDYWMSVRKSDSIQVEEPGNEVIDLKVHEKGSDKVMRKYIITCQTSHGRYEFGHERRKM